MKRTDARAGDYTDRVRVCQSTPSTNADGQLVESASDYVRRWAKVRTVGGSERPVAGQLTADLTHRVRLRYDAQTKSITPKMWLLLEDGTRLDIQRVVDVDRAHVELELECNQRV